MSKFLGFRYLVYRYFVPHHHHQWNSAANIITSRPFNTPRCRKLSKTQFSAILRAMSTCCSMNYRYLTHEMVDDGEIQKWHSRRGWTILQLPAGLASVDELMPAGIIKLGHYGPNGQYDKDFFLCSR